MMKLRPQFRPKFGPLRMTSGGKGERQESADPKISAPMSQNGAKRTRMRDNYKKQRKSPMLIAVAGLPSTVAKYSFNRSSSSSPDFPFSPAAADFSWLRFAVLDSPRKNSGDRHCAVV